MAHETLKSFIRAPLSVKDRMVMGKAYRQKTPRSTLGDYPIKHRRLDAVNIIARQAESRFPDLIPIRHARMAVDPFAFFRGGAAIMAQDLAEKTAKASPFGSDVALAAVKQAVNAANSAFDNLNKAAKQAAEFTEAGVSAATSAAVKAAGSKAKK